MPLSHSTLCHPLPKALKLSLALGLSYSVNVSAAITYSGDVSNAGNQNALLWNLGNVALDIGSASNAGTVTVNGSGEIRLNPRGSLDLGRDDNSSGTLEVTGSRARVNVGNNIDVGDHGIGVLRITNGGQVSTRQGYIGRLADSQGEALVSGAGSKFTTSSFLYVGNNGLGRLQVEAGGEVSANGVIDVGRNASAAPGEPADSVLITGAGSLLSTTRSLNIGHFDLSEGELTVTNRGQARAQEGYIGRQAGARGEVTISATGQWLLDEQLTVGNSGQGTLNIASAGVVRSQTGAIGRLVGSNGQVSMTGSGTLWAVVEQFLVGGVGDAALTLADGARVTSGSAIIAQGAGSNATAQLSGAGTQWRNTGNLVVGAAGSAALSLEQGVLLQVDQLRLATQAGSSASLRVLGGSTLEASQIVKGAGNLVQFELDNATLRATENQADYLSGIGSAVLGAAGLVLDDAGYAVGVKTGFSGSGGLTKQGLGGLTLASSSSYSGPTQVRSGVLYALSDNALGSGGAVSIAGVGSAAELHLRNVDLNNPINIGTQGQLFGIGSVASTVVQNGAIIAPGFGDSQIGTLHINGDLTFAVGGEYDVFMDIETGASDRLVVSGVADLNGAQLRYKGIGESYERGAWYEVLSAGTRVGQFSDVTSDYPFLQVLTDYTLDPNKVFIGLRRKVGVVFSDLAYTPNQKATARALEEIDAADLLDEFIETLPAGEPARMYDLLSGEIHASLRSSLQSWDGQVSQAALRSFNQTLVQAACEGDQQRNSLVEQYNCPTNQQWPIWLQTIGNWEHRRGDGNAAKGRSHAGGVLVGSAREIGHSGWQLGASLGTGYSDLDVSPRQSSAKINHYSAALLAGKNFAVGQDQLTLSAGLHYGYHQIKTERFIPRIEQKLKADYHGHNLQLSSEISYAFAAMQSLQLEPYLRLTFDQQKLSSFTEKGGFAGVNADASSRSHGYSLLGLRSSYHYSFAERPIEVSADLGWKRAWNHRDVIRTMNFNVGSPDFNIAGVDLPRDALVANLRGQWAINQQTFVELNLAGEFASHLNQQSALLGLRYEF